MKDFDRFGIHRTRLVSVARLFYTAAIYIVAVLGMMALVAAALLLLLVLYMGMSGAGDMSIEIFPYIVRLFLLFVACCIVLAGYLVVYGIMRLIECVIVYRTIFRLVDWKQRE